MKRTDLYLNKDYNIDLNNLSILGIIAIVVITIFITPWLSFWIAYFGGWVAKITIGNYLINGLEHLGILITKDQIPLLAGVLGWIGGFFKVSNHNTKKGN